MSLELLEVDQEYFSIQDSGPKMKDIHEESFYKVKQAFGVLNFENGINKSSDDFIAVFSEVISYSNGDEELKISLLEKLIKKIIEEGPDNKSILKKNEDRIYKNVERNNGVYMQLSENGGGDCIIEGDKDILFFDVMGDGEKDVCNYRKIFIECILTKFNILGKEISSEHLVLLDEFFEKLSDSCDIDFKATFLSIHKKDNSFSISSVGDCFIKAIDKTTGEMKDLQKNDFTGGWLGLGFVDGGFDVAQSNELSKEFLEKYIVIAGSDGLSEEYDEKELLSNVVDTLKKNNLDITEKNIQKYLQIIFKDILDRGIAKNDLLMVSLNKFLSK